MGINASRHQESDNLFGHQEKAPADSDVPVYICWTAFGTILKDLMDRLVGQERLEVHSTIWLNDKDADGTDKITSHQDKALSGLDALLSSNAKSCAVCWSFVCLKFVCDDCLTKRIKEKRIKEDGQNYRLYRRRNQMKVAAWHPRWRCHG